MPATAASERLKRILVMVPWVMSHPGCTVQEVCERFDMTREELAADLATLTMCGLPPFTPADLIEAWIDGDRVSIKMADFLARPPRLTRAEAIALLVTGRAVAALPGFEEGDSLARALGKLEQAVAPQDVEQTRDLSQRVSVDLGAAGTDLAARLREAARDRTTVEIVYYSAGRGEVTERKVDPLVIFSAAANWYLVAQDHRSGEERLFRVDRIKELRETTARFERPPGFDPARYEDPALFTPSPDDVEVVLDLGPAAMWIRDVVPYESEEQDRGRARVHLRTPHLAWLVRLLLAAGPAARVVAPQALVEQVHAAAQRTLALYEP